MCTLPEIKSDFVILPFSKAKVCLKRKVYIILPKWNVGLSAGTLHPSVQTLGTVTGMFGRGKSLCNSDFDIPVYVLKNARESTMYPCDNVE